MPRVEGRPGESLPSLDFTKLKAEILESHPHANERDVMSAALYPQVTDDFMTFRETFGPVDKLDTRIFLTGPKIGEEFEVSIEKGKTLHIKALAMAEDLTPNGEKEVFFELNGQLRSVLIRDKEGVKELHIHPKANKGNKAEIGAPMPGQVIDVRVKVGDKVEKGQPLVVLSGKIAFSYLVQTLQFTSSLVIAMKMEMVVQSPRAGIVKSLNIDAGMKLEGDDLILTFE